MPAAIPVAVGAIGAFATAKVQSNAAKRALASQDRASADALAYQKSRDVVDDSRYDKKWQAYQDYLADYRKRNGGATATTMGGGGGGGVAQVSLADLVNGQDTGEAQPQQVGSIADLAGGWNDWQRYGA